MKKLTFIYLFLLIIVVVYNYVVYEKYTKYLLTSAGNLSRMNYDLSYLSYERNEEKEDLNTLVFNGNSTIVSRVKVATFGDSFFNCSNEGACIQNYMNLNKDEILHLDLENTAETLIKYLKSTQFINNPPKYLMIERIEKGMTNTYSRNFKEIWDQNINEKFYSNEERKFVNFEGIEALKFLNFANIKLLSSMVFTLMPEWQFIKKLKAIIFNIGGEKLNLEKDLFSIHKKTLFYDIDDDISRKYTQKELENITENFLFLEKKLERYGTKLIVVIIPNKLTSYSKFVKNSKIINKYTQLNSYLLDHGIQAPNLLEEIENKLNSGIDDIYQPDDTHFSKKGTEIVGNYLGHLLQ